MLTHMRNPVAAALLVALAGLVGSASAFSPTLAPSLFTGSTAMRGSRLGPLRMQTVATPPQPALGLKMADTLEFWTRPRTTNANWGVFFEIEAKDKPVWITGLKAGGHSFATFADYTRLKMKVYSKEGKAEGFETDASAWELVAEDDELNLPRIEVGDSRAEFTSIPFETVEIPANSVRSFVIHTDRKTGLALRRKLNFSSNNLEDPYFKDWTDGVTDEGEHFKVIAGVCPGAKLFEEVSSKVNSRAFVGTVEYTLENPN